MVQMYELSRRHMKKVFNVPQTLSFSFLDPEFAVVKSA